MPPGPQPNRREHILVVDDDLLTREFLKDYLEASGFTAVCCSSAKEALEMLEEEKFQLIVSDINMPEMDGIAFFGALREMGSETPVIFLTGSDRIDNVVQAMKLGASDYIFKRKEMGETLLISVEKALEKRHLELENRRLLEDLKRFNAELTRRVEEATEELRAANQQLTKGMEELSMLHDVSRAISSLMEYRFLLNLIMQKTKDVLRAEASSLLVLSEDGTELVFEVAQGSRGERVKSFTVKLGQGISGHVAQTGESVLIDDAYEDPRFDPSYDQKTGFRTKSVMCVPLLVKDRVIGVCQIINKKSGGSFTRDELELFKAIAGAAAVAIENTRLYEKERKAAQELREALQRERWLSIEKEKMGKFVPRHLVEEIQKNREAKLALGGQSIEATVLFSDIAGFTGKSEKFEPTKVLQYLNGYMTAMVQQIELHGGILDKFMGDGLMAVFIDDADHPDHHALRAVRTALGMQKRIVRLDAEWQEAGLGPLGVRIGICTGKVLSGNVGSETRMDYTVLGDTVNLASRLETVSRNGEILINEEAFRHLDGRFHPAPIKNQPMTVKGREQPVNTYLVLPAMEESAVEDPKEEGP